MSWISTTAISGRSGLFLSCADSSCVIFDASTSHVSIACRAVDSILVTSAGAVAFLLRFRLRFQCTTYPTKQIPRIIRRATEPRFVPIRVPPERDGEGTLGADAVLDPLLITRSIARRSCGTPSPGKSA